MGLSDSDCNRTVCYSITKGGISSHLHITPTNNKLRYKNEGSNLSLRLAWHGSPLLTLKRNSQLTKVRHDSSTLTHQAPPLPSPFWEPPFFSELSDTWSMLEAFSEPLTTTVMTTTMLPLMPIPMHNTTNKPSIGLPMTHMTSAV